MNTKNIYYDDVKKINSIKEMMEMAVKDAGEKIRKALFKTLEANIKTADLGGNASCSEFTNAIIANL